MSLTFMFWGYLAGFALIALFVGMLAARLSGLEKRLQRLDHGVE